PRWPAAAAPSRGRFGQGRFGRGRFGAGRAGPTEVGAGPGNPDDVLSPGPIPDAEALGVGVAAWLNGLAEAASELRRHLLDRLRAGQLDVAEELLVAMEDVYDVVVTIDYPDAITGGLRRTTDALRAVLERSRADLTLTLVQARLQRTIDWASAGAARLD
ncbi:MAG: hypothetical protein ACRD0J_11120, partial [Acidimicrobiales bacterium]